MIDRDRVTRREGQKKNNRDASDRRVFEASGSRQGDAKWGGVASDVRGREGRTF